LKLFLALKSTRSTNYFFSGAAGAAASAAGAAGAAAGAAGASAAGAAGAGGASFLPQATKAIANKLAKRSDFFISYFLKIIFGEEKFKSVTEICD
jgi:3-oxoacyl-ACP reductase-like protein